MGFFSKRVVGGFALLGMAGLWGPVSAQQEENPFTVITPSLAPTSPKKKSDVPMLVEPSEKLESEHSQIGFIQDAPPGEGLRLGLKDCIQMTLLNNKELKAKNYEVEVAEWKLNEARPKGIPVFEYEFLSAPAPRNVDAAVESFFEGDITYFQKGHIGFGIPVMSFGKLKLAQELAKSGIAAEKEKKIDKQNDVLLQVHKLYYGLLLAKDVHVLLNDALKHMESEIRRRGESTEPSDPVELVRLKLFRYEILKRLGETERRTSLARDGLLIQMGLKRDTQYSLMEDHLQPVDFELREFDYYLELSRKYRPKGRLVDIGLKATETLYSLEKRKIAPDIGIGGFFEFGVTTNPIEGLVLTDDFNNPFNFTRIGVGLRIKGELNINQYRSKIKQAQAEYFKTAANKNAADEGLMLDLKETYLNVQQGKIDMENANRAMKLARQYVFITKTNADIGVGDKKDYSDALQAYLVARGRYLESVFDYNVAVATLEGKIGGVALHQ